MRFRALFPLALCLGSVAFPQGRGGRGGAATPETPQLPRTGTLPEETSAVTHHSIKMGAEQVNYTATAANYIIKDDNGAEKASMFFVSYTKDGITDAARRPISFVYNGGPGSGSLFTHMGLGPRRIVLTDDGHGMPAPYSIADNDASFLDATDMVFVDAIGTGYSRPGPGENPTQFYGVTQDAQWFSDFIYQYLTRNERWSSPKIGRASCRERG